MTLELVNTSRDQMTLHPLTGELGEDNHHFYLSFRPGTLYEAQTTVALNQESIDAGWALKYDEHPTDDIHGFFLGWKGTEDKTLAPLVPLEDVTLDHIKVDGAGGSRGTRVELKYRSVISAGSDQPLSGTRMHYVSVMDELPHETPLVVAAFTGSNTFLNDGQSETTRTLRLYNQSGGDLTLTTDSRITIRFPMASDDYPWGVMQGSSVTDHDTNSATTSQNDSVSIESVTQSNVSGAWSQVTPPTELTGNQVVFEISGAPGTLTEDGYIDVPITLKTSAANGVGHLHVQYEGFSHLEDTVLVPLLKSPLVINDTNVGIGTDDPQYSLDVKGDVRIGSGTRRAVLYFNEVESPESKWSISTTDSALRFKNDEDSSHQDDDQRCNARMVITQDGKVGIGANDPQTELDLRNGAAFIGKTGSIQGETGGVRLLLNNANQQQSAVQQHGSIAWIGHNRDIQSDLSAEIEAGSNTYDDQGYLAFKTSDDNMAPQERLRITESGNVGIGTSDPGEKLEVNGHILATQNIHVADGKHLVLGYHARSDSGQYIERGEYIRNSFPSGQDSGWGLSFYAGNTERMRIDASTGNVGIGTTTPGAKLVVKGTLTASESNEELVGLKIDPTFDDGDDHTGVKHYGLLVADGNVGIGTTNPGYPLEIGGGTSKRYTSGWVADGQVAEGIAVIQKAIGLHVDNAICCQAVVCESDERTKIPVGRSNSEDDLATLRDIEVADYTYIDCIERGSSRHKKLLAQQVQRIFPQAISASRNVVPDIFEMAEAFSYDEGRDTLSIVLKRPHGLRVADWVRVIGDDGPREVSVCETPDERTFTAKTEKVDGARLFVYGKRVDDFLSVDYDAISVLNVSATQELALRVEALESENADLRAACQRLEQLQGITRAAATADTLQQ